MEKTKEQLKKEMLKKVDIKKCKKVYAMSMMMKGSSLKGFEKILDEWAEAKLPLYVLFGENLKISKEITISKEECTEDAVFGETIQNIRREMREKIKEKVSDYLADFLDGIIMWSSFARDYPLFSTKCISSSLLKETLREQHGNRQIKFTKFIHETFNSEKLDTVISEIMQENSTEVKGHMYLSIDPFDYLTMSLNTSGWSSCHSMHNISLSYTGVEVGCYSAGIFSYMCDNVSLVGYRTNGQETDYKFNGSSFKAESKNWREMIFIHPTYNWFIASRQYPFNSETLSTELRKIVEDLIEDVPEQEESDTVATALKWVISRKETSNKKYISNYGFESYDCADVEETENIHNNDEGYEALHYNDMLHGWNYKMIYKNNIPKENLENIVIGSFPTCPICGRHKLTLHKQPYCDYGDCYRKVGELTREQTPVF